MSRVPEWEGERVVDFLNPPRWGVVLLAALALSCAAQTPAPRSRPTEISDGRTDDHWLEGDRCSPSTPSDAQVQIDVMEVGSGPEITSGMTVRAHYVAKAATGETLHDTHLDGPPNEIIVGSTHTICGFERGLAGMHAGEERRILIPWQLAFGELGRPPEVPPRTDLVLVVDLFLPADPTRVNPSSPVRATQSGGRRR